MVDTIDTATRLVDAYISGELDTARFDALLAEIAARDPSAITRVAGVLEQRNREGVLPSAAFSELWRCVDAYGMTRYSPVDRTRLHSAQRTRMAVRGTSPAASIDATLEPGVVVKQRFLLENKIGEGGMGVVFKARDMRNQRYEEYVAVKFLSDRLQDVPDALESLQYEVRRAHELAHPNIVTVYEFDRDGPLAFIYMELLEGEALDTLLKKSDQRGLPFEQAWPIIQGAGTALAYAHDNGIVHSDFKPGNVFITAENRVKILDFGIARATRRDPSEFDTSVLGGLTPGYASPEMTLQNLEPEPRDDIYALACVSYELLAGRHPFDRMPAHLARDANLAPSKIRGLSKRRMRALERGLAFERADRTPTVQKFLAELEAKPRSSRQWLRASVAAIIVAAAATGGVYSYTSSQQCTAVDREFLDAIRAEATPFERIDPSYRDVLLEQGEEYLGEAAADFDPTLLSEGVSNAFGAFKNALRIDPQSEVADAGIMRIIEAYRVRADELLEGGDAGGAAQVADYGLRLHPRHCALGSIKSRALALLK